jgi:hypothetical protein
LTTRAERAEAENVELRERLSELEREIRKLSAAASGSQGRELPNRRAKVKKKTRKA